MGKFYECMTEEYYLNARTFSRPIYFSNSKLSFPQTVKFSIDYGYEKKNPTDNTNENSLIYYTSINDLFYTKAFFQNHLIKDVISNFFKIKFTHLKYLRHFL